MRLPGTARMSRPWRIHAWHQPDGRGEACPPWDQVAGGTGRPRLLSMRQAR
jgi:hypothetical protein